MKSRYILTMTHYATRYPDAVALPSIKTERVAEAFVGMFSRIGVPNGMLIEHESRVTIEVCLPVFLSVFLFTFFYDWCHEWSKQVDISSAVDNYFVPTEQ